MKNKFIFFILFLLLTSLANAGETYDLDFKKTPAYILGVQPGDRVEFEMNNSVHTIIIKKIDLKKVDLAIFTYLTNTQENSPFYAVINKEKYLKLDVNRDSKSDLYVIYEKSNNTAASLRFQLPLSNNKDLEILPENQFKEKNFIFVLYILIPIAVIIIVLFVVNMVIKSKEKPESKQEDKKDKTDSEKVQ